MAGFGKISILQAKQFSKRREETPTQRRRTRLD
jgi:hypothetical protein